MLACLIRVLRELFVPSEKMAWLSFRRDSRRKQFKILYELALSCELKTMTYCQVPTDYVPGAQTTTPIADTGTSNGIEPSHPRHSMYLVPRSLLLENQNLQCLLCDPYLLPVATRYLGVFPVITKPDMWWDTDFLTQGL